MKYYCFVKDCYVGIMEFKDDGNITMTWEDESNFIELAKTYKKYMSLNTTEEILAFIGERVPDRRRPGLSVFLSGIGCHLNSSDLEIFTKNHGVSFNDCFWINETKDNSFWQKLRQAWNI